MAIAEEVGHLLRGRGTCRVGVASAEGCGICRGGCGMDLTASAVKPRSVNVQGQWDVRESQGRARG